MRRHPERTGNNSALILTSFQKLHRIIFYRNRILRFNPFRQQQSAMPLQTADSSLIILNEFFLFLSVFESLIALSILKDHQWQRAIAEERRAKLLGKNL